MTLSENWFTEGTIDFELQKYRLLAYLQEVQQHFGASRLYPQLSDVIFHYNNLLAFRKNRQSLRDAFPRNVEGVDAHRLRLIYEKILADDALMQELEDITLYASDRLKKTVDTGTGIYDFVEGKLRLEPVGLLPMYRSEGFLLLRYGNVRELRTYRYTLTLFTRETSSYRSLKLNYISTYPLSAGCTPESAKRELIRYTPELPQPAVYLAETPLEFPFQETLLPVAKRCLMRHLAREAA